MLLWKILEETVTGGPERVVCILDGLDKCHKDSPGIPGQSMLLRKLTRFYGSINHKVEPTKLTSLILSLFGLLGYTWAKGCEGAQCSRPQIPDYKPVTHRKPSIYKTVLILQLIHEC
jgi:hypothetical protein